MSESVSKARSRVAHESKKQKKSGQVEAAPSLIEARRDLAAAKLEAYVTRLVDQSPALSPEQQSAIALILRGAR